MFPNFGIWYDDLTYLCGGRRGRDCMLAKEVHDIIVSCVVTKPEDRLDISRIRKLLSNILITFQGGNVIFFILE
jgi:hypothetical protein